MGCLGLQQSFNVALACLFLTGSAFGQVDHSTLLRHEQEYLSSLRALGNEASPDEAAGWIRDYLGTYDDPQALESLKTRLEAWFASQASHQRLIDRLNVEKFDFFLKQLDESVTDIHSEAKTSAKAAAAYRRFKNAYPLYVSRAETYGSPKDTLRLAAIRELFAAAKEYFAEVDRLMASRPERFQRWLQKAKSAPQRFFQKMKMLKVAPEAAQMARDILLGDGGRINATANSAFLKAAKMKGYDVRILGMENLDLARAHEPHTVNIVTAVHRGPVLDNIFLAHLKLKDYVFVTSFGSVMPAWIAKRIQGNPGLAFVGPGFPNGVETVTEKAIHNSERVMVNYAEGSIGNMGESRPIAVKFGTVLIPELQKKGYRVNLIPVTSQPASFLKQDQDPAMIFGKNMDAQVHRPITNEMIEVLKKTGHLDKLGILIRSTWLRELHTDLAGGLHEGALSVGAVEEMILKYLFPDGASPSFCSSVFSQKQLQ